MTSLIGDATWSGVLANKWTVVRGNKGQLRKSS